MNNPYKMDDDRSHKRKHKKMHKHEGKHRTKFSEDSPEDAVEKREISSRVGNGVLTDKEALYGAPTAPSGTYVGESFDAATGDVIRFIGAKVPLYITPEVLDYEFVNFLKNDTTGAMGEVVSKGKPPTNEDKIVMMARTMAGRKALANYKDPSELFARDSGAKPMLVRDYYLKEDGLKGQVRGIRAEVTSKISESQKAQLATLGTLFQGLVVAAPAAAKK